MFFEWSLRLILNFGIFGRKESLQWSLVSARDLKKSQVLLEFKCRRTSCGLEMSWVFESQDVFSVESQKVMSCHLPISVQARLPKPTTNVQGILCEHMSQWNCKFLLCCHGGVSFSGGHFPGKQGANVIGATFDKWLGGSRKHPNWSNHTVNHFKCQ